MNCQQARPLIEPYADGEVDAATVVELEQHLRDCPACALAWRTTGNLRKTLGKHAVYFAAPPELRQRIQLELQALSGVRPWWKPGNWSWFSGLATGAATAGVAALLIFTLHPSEPQRLGQEIVSSHIRSLMANHELDVVSSDQHTVKPWFNGKLDFSPPVKDLAAQEFNLIGGRLDYLGNRSVAALIFQRHKHVINLFIWPTPRPDSGPKSVASIQGYNGIQWTDAGMIFWAVSDLNAKELLEFAQDYAAGTQLK